MEMERSKELEPDSFLLCFKPLNVLAKKLIVECIGVSLWYSLYAKPVGLSKPYQSIDQKFKPKVDKDYLTVGYGLTAARFSKAAALERLFIGTDNGQETRDVLDYIQL